MPCRSASADTRLSLGKDGCDLRTGRCSRAGRASCFRGQAMVAGGTPNPASNRFDSDGLCRALPLSR